MHLASLTGENEDGGRRSRLNVQTSDLVLRNYSTLEQLFEVLF